MHWMYVVVPIVVAVGSLVVTPMFRSAKSLNDRMRDQLTRSAELLKECSTMMGGETVFGRPPASR
jgi:hypothetical protein